MSDFEKLEAAVIASSPDKVGALLAEVRTLRAALREACDLASDFDDGNLPEATERIAELRKLAGEL